MFRALIITAVFAYVSHSFAQSTDTARLLQVHGMVTDSVSGAVLQATVHVFTPDTDNELSLTDTNTDGQYGLVLQIDSAYDLVVELEGYRISRKAIRPTEEKVGQLELDFRLTKESPGQ